MSKNTRAAQGAPPRLRPQRYGILRATGWQRRFFDAAGRTHGSRRTRRAEAPETRDGRRRPSRPARKSRGYPCAFRSFALYLPRTLGVHPEGRLHYLGNSAGFPEAAESNGTALLPTHDTTSRIFHAASRLAAIPRTDTSSGTAYAMDTVEISGTPRPAPTGSLPFVDRGSTFPGSPRSCPASLRRKRGPPRHALPTYSHNT